ncbi:MAG: hypothetical protein BMS9Abin29_2460 [Gemmatimonadota bacterium]|nr:MAG: hypothetical protein BMS9Abin29_2460 [Gemmatimonadota bacterium]
MRHGGTFLTHRARRIGAMLVLGLAACSQTESGPERAGVDTTLFDSLGIDLGRMVERVALGGAREREHVVPPTILVESGTVVEFYTVDRRVHSITFVADSLTLLARRFLDGKGQLSSPPLVDLGSRFVVDFMDAPPGRYPYLSHGNGESTRGVIVVVAD